jgi:hypothetical protein
MTALKRQIRQQQEREEQAVANVWEERLNETYAAARRGLARAEDDEEKWTAAVGFLSQMNKAVETGLKATGQIEGGSQKSGVHIDQVLILPLPSSAAIPRRAEVVTIEASTIAEREEK